MAFKTFAPGVLTSSDVNTFLMRQAVITCTSSTRPASPSEGMTIYETDTDALAIYTGSAWKYRGYYESFTPVFYNSWSVGNGTVTAKVAQIGDFVHGYVKIVWGSTSSFGSGGNFKIEFPITPSSESGGAIGLGEFADVSAGPFFPIRMAYRSSGGVGIAAQLDVHNNAFNDDTVAGVSNTRPVTWADGDVFRFNFYYEAA